MGLSAYIFKSSLGNFSNGGVSSRANQVVIVNVPGSSKPSEAMPPVMLQRGAYPGIAVLIPAALGRACGKCGAVADGNAGRLCNDGGLVSAHSFQDAWVPARPEGCFGPMMGGDYVACSDSRFVDKVEEITGAKFYGAVALHDRFESVALYRELSAD